MEQQLFTLRQAAPILGTTMKALRMRVQRGQVPTVKIGGTHNITRAYLEGIGAQRGTTDQAIPRKQ
jgi:hypothetical protein